MSQVYVPEGVFLVCSEGMKKSELKISSQSSIKISGGKLAGTINDRFLGNFICSKMMLAGAIIGAIVAAIFVAATILTGGAIGVGLAMAIGAAAATGGAVQGAMMAIMPSICSMLCSGAKWYPVQDKVLFEKQPALLENSRITCFLGGQVMIFYSEKTADEFVSLARNNALIKIGGTILGSTLLSAAIAGISTASATFFKNVAFVKNTFGGKATFLYLGENAVYFGAGVGGSVGVDYLKGKGYELIQNETGFKIKDYADGKVIEEADTKLETSSLLPKPILEFKDNLKESLPEWLQEHFPETIPDMGEKADYIADGIEVLGENNPQISHFDEIGFERQTLLTTSRGAVEESDADRVSSQSTNTIRELRPNRTELPINEMEFDRSGAYYNNEDWYLIEGRQFHITTWKKFINNLGKSLVNAIPDADFWKSLLSKSKKGMSFPIEITLEGYNILSNMLLEENIKSFEDTKQDEENARNRITVKTETK